MTTWLFAVCAKPLAGSHGSDYGAMVATAIVAWPAAPLFLFMHGKDVTIPKGTEITAYVDGEIKTDAEKLATVRK